MAGIIVFGLRNVLNNSLKNPNPTASSTNPVPVQSTSPATNSNSSALTVNEISNATLPDFIDTNSNGTTFTLTNGEFDGSTTKGQTDLSSYDVAMKTASTSYAYGDLNGDGASDMVATIDANTGGTGTFTYLLAFINVKGQPQYVDSQLLGDRIKVNGVSIQNGIIAIDIITQGPGEPMCCGTMPATLKFKLQGNSLVQIGGDSTTTATDSNPIPVITSITPSSGPTGTTVVLKGTNLAGFEGELDAWIQNVKTSEVGFLPGIGSVPRADQTIRVKIENKVCKENLGMKGGSCASYMVIAPGIYNIYTIPWGNTSNKVKFTVTK